MASSRERRSNAGNRMSQLLESQEEDEFYKNTYGGFDEEAADDEYKSEEEESDEVDTDFSIDEDDELASDGQDDDEQPRKRKKIFVSKALQRQQQKQQQKKTKKKSKLSEERDTKQMNECGKREKRQTVRGIDAKKILSSERKSIRKSTKEKSEATQRRHREREEMLKCREKKTVTEYRRLTQEELLAEARITEQKNLKSLESYQRLELERKKARVVKQKYSGPIIRYHSVSMPIVKMETEKINVVDDIKEGKTSDGLVDGPTNVERCSRNFVTFTDEMIFRSHFRNVRPHVPQRNTCPITRMPARYYDPVTQMAYANLQAFKVLREAYYQQLEQKGDRKQPDVAAWIDWRKRVKGDQQAQSQFVAIQPPKALA